MSHVTYEWVTSHMNESRHIWTSYVAYECVVSPACIFLYRHTWRAMTHPCLSYSNVSRHIWMSHVTYEWVTSHMNESRHIWMSHVISEWVTSYLNKSRHIWMCHVPKIRFSCTSIPWRENNTSVTGLQQCVTSHMNVSHHISTNHVTSEWVMSPTIFVLHQHTLESHDTFGTGSWQWVASYMNESRHIWMSHVPSIFFWYRHTWRAITHLWRSHSNGSRHLWMSRVTCKWVTSILIESCP